MNAPDDVPVHQVKEFSPAISFGGSASQSGLIALALTDNWREFGAAVTAWPRDRRVLRGDHQPGPWLGAGAARACATRSSRTV